LAALLPLIRKASRRTIPAANNAAPTVVKLIDLTSWFCYFLRAGESVPPALSSPAYLNRSSRIRITPAIVAKSAKIPSNSRGGHLFYSHTHHLRWAG
jgi:hypothetical protein